MDQILRHIKGPDLRCQLSIFDMEILARCHKFGIISDEETQNATGLDTPGL